MLDNKLIVPIQFFHDEAGQALSNGYIYVGEDGRDAESYPVTAYWDADLTIAADQPIRTINGRPDRDGAAGTVHVAGTYSLKVKNATEEVVYSTLSVVENSVVSVVNYAALDAYPNTLDAGTLIIDQETARRYLVVESGEDFITTSGIKLVYRWGDYQSVTALKAGHEPSRAVDAFWRAGDLWLQELSPSATEYNIINQSGVKMNFVQFGANLNAVLFGADPDGVTDSLAAFEAARDAGGEFGSWYAPPGKYDLSAPFKASIDNQTIGMIGVNLNNSWVNERPGINITGRPVIDPDAFGNRSPFFGVLDCYAQDRSHRSFRVFNVGGAAYISGGTYRGQVAVGDLSVYSENCGVVASHSHGDDGIVSYSRTASPSSVPSITNAGSGYSDGRWIAPATGGSGSGAVIAFDVDGGAVTDAFVIHGGKDYSTGNVLSFDNAAAVNSQQGTLTAGSGFALTVGDVMDGSTWFNENNFEVAANGGWFGGVLGYGKFNYNSIRYYLEAIYSRFDDLVYIDEGVDNAFDKLSLLVNSNVGETTDRTAKLLNMPNATGTIVRSGRSGNPFSTSTDPLGDLFDFGAKAVPLFDAFSDIISTRGNDYRDFTPAAYGSTGSTDFVPTYNTQKGRFRERAGVVEFVVELDFDSNAYTVNPGNLFVDMSDLVAKIGGEEPNSNITFWPVEVTDLKTFNLSTDTLFIKSYWQNNQDYIRIFQTENTGGSATDDALGTAEMAASTAGYRIALKGQVEI